MDEPDNFVLLFLEPLNHIMDQLRQNQPRPDIYGDGDPRVNQLTTPVEPIDYHNGEPPF